MNFSNSYSMNLYRQQQARKDHGENTHGAERSGFKDKDKEQRIARNEYRCEEIAKFNSDLARYYDRGLNPPRELLEQIYERG